MRATSGAATFLSIVLRRAALCLAIAAGALSGRGYGESVGAVIEREEIILPSSEELRRLSADTLDPPFCPHLQLVGGGAGGRRVRPELRRIQV